MDETQLRQLEKRLKLRVKTGCETCRKCDGYKHVDKLRDGSPSAAASYRNSAFLVIPQKAMQSSISRSPSRSFSPDPLETRSFHYFQTYTLPRWTEFFESELWSQKVLQLSHSDPAIKHGILALSTLHERFENRTPSYHERKTSDFAFVQYMQAVKHSNDLLTAHLAGDANLERVLIACIIFTCYENLAGNFAAANMHLRNGLRILRQHKNDQIMQPAASGESIGSVLYRFDLQAMTFSENASPYDFTLDTPPECPQIPQYYANNSAARNDLVDLMRCMLWVAGVADSNPQAPEHPTWLRVYSQLKTSFEEWDNAFSKYQLNFQQHEQADAKIHAGNTLLKMYATMTRIIVASGAGTRTEMAWDPFVDSFKSIVDLADTLPVLRPHRSPLPSSSRSSLSPSPGPSQPPENRRIAPNPRNITSPAPPPSDPFTTVFRVEPSPPPHPPSAQSGGVNATPTAKRTPSSFSPSFELSPIVPLFLTACRCRDPITRRHAIALLLTCRRREGVWNSVGAGIVGLDWLKQEEGLEHVDLQQDNWVPLTSGVRRAGDVPEERRVLDVHLKVDAEEGSMAFTYKKLNGGEWEVKRGLREVGMVIGSGGDRVDVGGLVNTSDAV
ncbi:Nn.00g087980.m01.CDS01 [Neocucurbitaria sp. VM-36]